MASEITRPESNTTAQRWGAQKFRRSDPRAADVQKTALKNIRVSGISTGGSLGQITPITSAPPFGMTPMGHSSSRPKVPSMGKLWKGDPIEFPPKFVDYAQGAARGVVEGVADSVLSVAHLARGATDSLHHLIVAAKGDTPKQRYEARCELVERAKSIAGLGQLLTDAALVSDPTLGAPVAMREEAERRIHRLTTHIAGETSSLSGPALTRHTVREAVAVFLPLGMVRKMEAISKLPTAAKRIGDALVIPWDKPDAGGLLRYTVFLEAPSREGVFNIAVLPKGKVLQVYAESIAALRPHSTHTLTEAKQFLAHLTHEAGCQTARVHSSASGALERWLRRDSSYASSCVPDEFLQLHYRALFAQQCEPLFASPIRSVDLNRFAFMRRSEEGILNVPSHVPIMTQEPGRGIWITNGQPASVIMQNAERTAVAKGSLPCPSIRIDARPPSATSSLPPSGRIFQDRYQKLIVLTNEGLEGVVPIMLTSINGKAVHIHLSNIVFAARKGGALDALGFANRALMQALESFPSSQKVLLQIAGSSREEVSLLKMFRQLGYPVETSPLDTHRIELLNMMGKAH